MAQQTDKTETAYAAAEIETSLTGRRCWYAYTSFGNTFQIALGRKIARDPAEVALNDRRRQKRLTQQASRRVKTIEDPLGREFDRYEGESNLLVWCAWRLDGPRSPITSWDDDAERCENGIRRLIGRTVRQVIIKDGWDLQADFSGGLTLHVFPDHVGPDASFDGNWEVWRPADAFLIGTDLSCETIAREKRAFRTRNRPAQVEVRPRMRFPRLRTIKRVSA